MTIRLLAAALLSVVVLGCSATGGVPASPATSAPTVASPSGPTPAPASALGADLTIFGAASLAGVLDAAKAAFETANPGSKLTISTDSSAALETQRERVAPDDAV